MCRLCFSFRYDFAHNDYFYFPYPFFFSSHIKHRKKKVKKIKEKLKKKTYSNIYNWYFCHFLPQTTHTTHHSSLNYHCLYRWVTLFYLTRRVCVGGGGGMCPWTCTQKNLYLCVWSCVLSTHHYMHNHQVCVFPVLNGCLHYIMCVYFWGIHPSCISKLSEPWSRSWTKQSHAHISFLSDSCIPQWD